MKGEKTRNSGEKALIFFLDEKQRCKSYQLANLYPSRAVALGCVYTTMRGQGLLSAAVGGEDLTSWVRDISSGKVDVEDFAEVVEELGRL